MPGMWRGRRAMDDVAGTIKVPRLRMGDVFDGWHGVPRHPQAPANVVFGNVVHHQPEERGECAGPPERIGARQLRDGLDLAAQAASGDGAALAGTTSPARSKSTKPMSAAHKRANVAGGQKRKRSSLWRPRKAGAASAESACGASWMCRRRAW